MSQPFDGMKVIGFDLETTGFDCRSERIVEYAMVGSDSDGKHISLCSLVDPEQKIPEQASSVHGITNSDVKGMGNFSDHSEKISEMMEGAVIVGHNVVGFDWGSVSYTHLTLPTIYSV